jgi:hypothetical protein
MLCHKNNKNHSELIILSTFRYSTNDLKYHLSKLGDALSYIFKPGREFAICGNFTVGYSSEHHQKMQLNYFLKPSNLTTTIN